MTNKTDREIAEEELERIRRMAFNGTADSFLSLRDEDKKLVLAAYEQRIADLEEVITEIIQEHEIPASDWIKEILK